jgi:phage terminase small subunit
VAKAKTGRPVGAELRGLTPKQRRFVAEFSLDCNSTQAAIRAGYSRKNADKIGPELLGKTRVREAIDRRLAQIEARSTRKLDHVISELTAIGFSNMGDYLKFTDNGEPVIDIGEHLTAGQLAAIRELVIEDFTVGRGDDARAVRRITIKLHDKRAALFDLGRHFGAFTGRGVIDLEGTAEKLDDLELSRRVSFILDRGRRELERSKAAGELLTMDQASAPVADTGA